MPTQITELATPDHVGADGWEVFAASVELENAVQREHVGSDDLGWTAEQVLANVRAQEYHVKRAWVAVDDDAVVGLASYQRSRDHTDPTAHLSLVVDQAHRRRGIGTALLQTVLEVCGTDEVTHVHTTSALADLTASPRLAARTGVGDIPAEAPGTVFLSRAGFRLEQVEVLSALPLPVPDDLLTELESGLRPAAGYDLVSWTGDTPDDLLDAYARLRTVMSTAAPTGEMTRVEEVWDADRVQDRDARNREMKITGITTAARARATGELVAFTALSIADVPGHAVGQGYTLVLPEHRGHHLGMRVKIANLRRLAEHGCSARRVVTGNAGENEAMLSINRAIGYRPTWVCGWWELALDQPVHRT